MSEVDTYHNVGVKFLCMRFTAGLGHLQKGFTDLYLCYYKCISEKSGMNTKCGTVERCCDLLCHLLFCLVSVWLQTSVWGGRPSLRSHGRHGDGPASPEDKGGGPALTTKIHRCVVNCVATRSCWHARSNKMNSFLWLWGNRPDQSFCPFQHNLESLSGFQIRVQIYGVCFGFELCLKIWENHFFVKEKTDKKKTYVLLNSVNYSLGWKCNVCGCHDIYCVVLMFLSYNKKIKISRVSSWNYLVLCS